MAFGFLGDIVEGVADVFLPPKGTRGSTVGKTVGSYFGGSVGGAVGSAIGGSVSQQLSQSTGKSAVSTPTVAQSPAGASESAGSGTGLNVYQPDYASMLRTNYPVPRVPTPRPTQQGPNIMDFIPDINITKFFGGNGCAQAMPKLVGMTRDGCPTVTRKQQRVLRNMAQYMPLESVAYEAGVDVTTMARLISKTFPTRSKGISGAQLKTANRVNNKILSMAHRLGYECKPMTTVKRGCK
jgi:hypothetical protein